MKALARIACVLISGLLAGCGGVGDGASAGTASAAPDSRLVMDSMGWDQGDWAE